MNYCPTDAHCHIGGASLDFNAAVCAINEPQWQELANVKNAKIKKVYGLFLGEALSHSDVELTASMQLLKTHLQNASAIGEFGLDKRFVSVLPFFRQEKIFDEHICIVAETKLPFVLHCVGAWGFLFKKVRSAFSKGQTGKFLLHSASCSKDIATEFAKIGGYFSFSMRALNSRNGAEVASCMPIERIMLESDELPSAEVYASSLERLAQLRNISAEKLSEIIEANFFSFYN